jgi:hypothetical protein
VDKIERLEAIIAAGDRVARAAATLGEKRDIDTLAEEDEEESEEETTFARAQQVPFPTVPVLQTNGTGTNGESDVIGTVSPINILSN